MSGQTRVVRPVRGRVKGDTPRPTTDSVTGCGELLAARSEGLLACHATGSSPVAHRMWAVHVHACTPVRFSA